MNFYNVFIVPSFNVGPCHGCHLIKVIVSCVCLSYQKIRKLAFYVDAILKVTSDFTLKSGL